MNKIIKSKIFYINNKLKKILLFLSLIVAIVILCFIYYYSGSSKQINISINKEDFLLSKNGSSEIILDNADLKKGIELKNRSNYVVFADRWILLPQKVKLLKSNRIEGKEYINLKTKNKNSFKFSRHKVRLISKNLSNYSSSGKLSSNKNLYLAIYDNLNPPKDSLVKLDCRGNVSYYKQTLSFANQFKTMESSKDKIRYGYLGDSVLKKGKDHANSYIILDENYKVIDEFLISNTKTQYIDLHDSLYIDDGHYIVASFYYNILKGKKVVAYKIEEMENGKTKWSFDTADYPKFIETMHLKDYEENSMLRNEKAILNYLHFNSFALDPKDNNLLVSFRDQDAIFKLSRKTGKIMWILGGDNDEFGLTENQKFIHQHSISIEKDGSILMYDNGDGKRNSRITEIKIDEKSKKVIDYKTYDLKGVYTNTYGTVEEVNKDKGLYLINYGQGINPNKHDVEEVNLKTGKVSFWFDFIDYDVKSVHQGD